MFLPFAGALGALNPGSIDFESGSAQSIETAANVAAIGAGDFTVETRFKLDDAGTEKAIGGVGGAVAGGLYVFVQSNAVYLRLNNGTFTTSPVGVVAGSTYDLAVTRTGTSVRVFLDGALQNTQASAQNVLGYKVIVGQKTQTGGSEVDGLIGFFHVTARSKYTASYTPKPVIEPDDDTLALIHNPTGIAIEEASGLALTLNNSPTADPTFLI